MGHARALRYRPRSGRRPPGLSGQSAHRRSRVCRAATPPDAEYRTTPRDECRRRNNAAPTAHRPCRARSVHRAVSPAMASIRAPSSIAVAVEPELRQACQPRRLQQDAGAERPRLAEALEQPHVVPGPRQERRRRQPRRACSGDGDAQRFHPPASPDEHITPHRGAGWLRASCRTVHRSQHRTGWMPRCRMSRRCAPLSHGHEMLTGPTRCTWRLIASMELP